jgi:hypothetical protein
MRVFKLKFGLFGVLPNKGDLWGNYTSASLLEKGGVDNSKYKAKLRIGDRDANNANTMRMPRMLNAIRNYEYIRMLRNDFVNAIRNYEYIRMLRTFYTYAMRIRE